MKRTPKHFVFMRMAMTLAERATCPRAQVGAIVVDAQGFIRGGGYNGAPKGMAHCKGDCTYNGHCARSIHAEENAITTSKPANIAGGSIYCTHFPCPTCQLKIIQAGITSVYFLQDYRRDGAPNHLAEANVHFQKVEP